MFLENIFFYLSKKLHYFLGNILEQPVNVNLLLTYVVLIWY